jgi:hypothetical protein
VRVGLQDAPPVGLYALRVDFMSRPMFGWCSVFFALVIRPSVRFTQQTVLSGLADPFEPTNPS